jgi:hypothetical protein
MKIGFACYFQLLSQFEIELLINRTRFISKKLQYADTNHAFKHAILVVKCPD